MTGVDVSAPDWDTLPRQVDLGTTTLEVGSLTADDSHVLVVRTRDRRPLTFLVIPPDFTTAQGAEALLAASTPGNSHSGSEVLREVTDQHDADPADRWTCAQDGTAGGRRSDG